MPIESPQQLLYVLKRIQLTREQPDLAKAIHQATLERKCSNAVRLEAFMAVAEASQRPVRYSEYTLEESQDLLERTITYVENYKPPSKDDNKPFWAL